MSIFKRKKEDNRIEIPVFGMTCGHCEMNVKNSLEKIDGVKKADVNHKKNNAIVTFDLNKEMSIETLKNAIQEIGFSTE